MTNKCLAVILVVAAALLPATALGDVPTQGFAFSATTTGVIPLILNLQGASTCGVTVYSVGGGATIVPQVASDGPVSPQTWVTATTINTGSITTIGSFVGGIATLGITNFRVNITALTSGTVSGFMSCSGAGGGSVSGSVTISNFPASQTVAQATGTNLHVVCDSGCSAPSAATYTDFTATGTTVIKGTPGTIFGVQNLAGVAQTNTITCFDNATTGTGNQLTAVLTLGAGQTILFGNGVAATAGITCVNSGAMTTGVQVLWK